MSGTPHDYPSSPSQVSVESSDSSASSTTDVDTAPSRLVHSWWLLGLLSIAAIAAVSLVLAMLATPAPEPRMNDSINAYYMDELRNKVYANLSHNAVVMSMAPRKMTHASIQAHTNSEELRTSLRILWPVQISNASTHEIMDDALELIKATSNARDPVRHFESQIREVLVNGGLDIEDTWDHENKYNKSGPQWFMQEAAHLNDRESELSPSSRSRPWTGRELTSQMHWESVCHVYDNLRESLQSLITASEKVLERIEACIELYLKIEKFTCLDIASRAAKALDDEKRVNATLTEWNARWSTSLYKCNIPVLTTIMSWIIDPEPPKYEAPKEDYKTFTDVITYLLQIKTDVRLLDTALRQTWNETSMGPEVNRVARICKSRDDRGVSSSEKWHWARVQLHDTWAEFGKAIHEWNEGMGLHDTTKLHEYFKACLPNFPQASPDDDKARE
ncbi:hypothetical protein BFW01_g1688 [Lasiodiplodia theobromae]|nr:hypothetical protein BFW01_g1688 [Lasiodiplodia theobromae]